MLDRVPRDAPPRSSPRRGAARDQWLKLGLGLALVQVSCLARFEVGDSSGSAADSGSGADASTTAAEAMDMGGSETDAGACQPGQTECGAGCVDLQSDRDNCGSCGNDCETGESCQLGDCVEACAPACDPIVEQCVGGECQCREGLDPCGGACVDRQTDPQHCGSCNMDCGAEVCQDGDCVSECGEELVDCDGACVDLDRDPLHCGGCAMACGGDELCIEGECYGYAPIDCDTDLDCNGGLCCELDESEKICLYGDQCP